MHFLLSVQKRHINLSIVSLWAFKKPKLFLCSTIKTKRPDIYYLIPGTKYHHFRNFCFPSKISFFRKFWNFWNFGNSSYSRNVEKFENLGKFENFQNFKKFGNFKNFGNFENFRNFENIWNFENFGNSEKKFFFNFLKFL